MNSATRPPLSLDELMSQASWLRSLAVRLLHDRDQAEDVAQDALIAGWQKPPGAGRGARTWLARVARNRAHDRWRTDSRQHEREREHLELRPEVSDPETLLARAQLQRQIATIVMSLDEPFRQAVLMRYYEGLSGAAIATALGVPPGTVRWRVKEGLDRIRARLDEQHGDDRRAWQRGLLPLVPPLGTRSPGAGRPALVRAAKQAALVAGAGAAVVFIVHTGRLSGRTQLEGAITEVAVPDPSAAGLSKARASTAGVETGAPSAAPIRPGDPARAACVERVRAVHDELAAVERDLFHWDTDFAFALGGPNPAAEAEVRPLVEEWAEQEGSIEHRLACTTWVCRIAVRRRGGGFGGGPYDRLASRLARGNTRSAPEALGLRPAPGEMVLVADVVLRDPSGHPRPDAQEPPPTPLPSPEDPAACAAAQRALGARLDDLRSRWRAAEPLDHKFDRGARNQRLEADLARWQTGLSSLFSTDQCQGSVCKRTPSLPLLPSWLFQFDLEVLRAHYHVVRARIGSGPSYVELEPQEDRRSP